MKLQKHQRPTDWMVVRWMLILRPAIMTATLMAILVFPQEAIDKTPIAFIVFGTYLLTFLYWFSHYFLGTSAHLLAVQISFDIFLITTIIHYTGGYDSSFVGFYFLVVMCASLFFRRFITFLFSMQAVVFYVLYLFVIGPEFDPFFITEDSRTSAILQALMYSALILGIGFFSSYFGERLIQKDSVLISALDLLKKARLDTSDILQSMTNGLITLDTSGHIIYMNRAAKKILEIDDEIVEGKKHETVLGKRGAGLAEILNRELHEPTFPSELETDVYNRDGEPVAIGLTSVPLYDTDGSSRGIIVNFKDLTEKNKLIKMISQSDRMAAIGELSAAIAHEIKNPLASICSAVEILAESVEKKDRNISKLLDVVEKESERLQRISTDFLQFARMKPPDIQPVELKKVIEDVLILINNDPRKTEGITIINHINCQDNNTVVMFDPDNLKQIIINLLVNSLQALDGDGKIEFTLEKSEQPDKKYVRLVVNDDGPGFPEEALGHMFEPFFSTKETGTGLGLAIVRKMTISNNGRVFAQNRLTGGAEVALDILLKGAD